MDWCLNIYDNVNCYDNKIKERLWIDFYIYNIYEMIWLYVFLSLISGAILTWFGFFLYLFWLEIKEKRIDIKGKAKKLKC